MVGFSVLAVGLEPERILVRRDPPIIARLIAGVQL
jgi:hypothetical protein